MSLKVTPHTFTLTRDLKHSPERVFAAWSDPVAKAAWFSGPQDWESGPGQMDFRVGGKELSQAGPKDGPWHVMEAVYHNIIPNERIIWSFSMHVGGVLLTVSLATLQLIKTDFGTRLSLTEQLVFLDGCDHIANREEGTNIMLDMLEASLNRQ